MDCSTELLSLALLLRTGAKAARDIGSLRPKDKDAIERLAFEAEEMAVQIDAIVAGGGDDLADDAD